MITFNSLVNRAKILNEANLYNLKDLENAVYSVIGNVAAPIKDWFKKKYISWYTSSQSDFTKDTGPYNRKEGDANWTLEKDYPHSQEREFSDLGPNWEPSKPAVTSKGIVVFNSLTDADIKTIEELKMFLLAVPLDQVPKITYAAAIKGAEDARTISITSPVWRDRVSKYYADIDILLRRSNIDHEPNAKQWFKENFMYYFFEECPEFNANSGIDPDWNTKIETLMHYVSSMQIADEGYMQSLIDDNVDPATLMAEAQANNDKITESNIKPLTEGIDYIKFDPLFNYTASAENKRSYEEFNREVRSGNYKFIRLITQKSFVNEGEKLQHCVKSDHYQHAEDHTLISLWKGDSLTGEPRATMEFSIEDKLPSKGADLTPATRSMIKALREADTARKKLTELTKASKSTPNKASEKAVQAAMQALEKAETAADQAVKRAAPITCDSTSLLDSTTEIATMTQCKGKGNRAPEEKRVQKILRKFVTLNDINITQDGEKIGLRQWQRKFYDPDSQKWDQVFKDEIIPAQQKAFKEIKMRIIDADTGKKVYPNG